MEIYIEDAIFQNLIINYLLLRLSENALLQKVKKIRIILASVIGTILTILINFYTLYSLINVCIKILIALIMTFICVERFIFKKISLFFAILLSSTFLMGGFCLGIENLFNISMNGFLTILMTFIYYKLLNNVLIQFYTKRKINHFYYNLKLKNKGKEFKIKAYLDSGNLLQDDETGLSILVVDYNTFNSLFENKVTLMDLLQNKIDKKIKGKYITCSTVGGKSNLFVCEIDKVVALDERNLEKNKEIHVLVGVGMQSFKNKECSALISPLAF